MPKRGTRGEGENLVISSLSTVDRGGLGKKATIGMGVWTDGHLRGAGLKWFRSQPETRVGGQRGAEAKALIQEETALTQASVGGMGARQAFRFRVVFLGCHRGARANGHKSDARRRGSVSYHSANK